MEEEKTVDPIFKKGFEHGYWLRRGNSPELNDLIQRAANHKGYYTGLKAGSKEAEREMFLDKLQKQKADKEQKPKGPKRH
ncbi:hypothetical protein [Taibaiella koreensis]|uniref:hypothetical protein n=1 Tax=Taibaiella koreensis TaxID=1268548 RepID=UPI000E59DD45|nr:hypothetical protein [Taibaiella koreensis]